MTAPIGAESSARLALTMGRSHLPSRFATAAATVVAVVLAGLWGSVGEAVATPSPPPGSIGALDSSRYDATQLQGDLVASGQGLIRIPGYLTAPGQDITYQLRPGTITQIPFVDHFQIARFLGAWDPVARNRRTSPASLDFERRQHGVLVFSKAILKARLERYLAAGYSPSDITLSVDNIPWAIAARGGHLGAYGQNNPPASEAAWANEMTHFARDLKSLFGWRAAGFRYKIGVEFDASESFHGTAREYFRLYNTAYRSIRRVFPRAKIAPAEFTGNGECPRGNRTCVYSMTAFLNQAAAAHTWPAFVPRSLNAFLNVNSAFPSASVSMAVRSYEDLGRPVTAEIDQFGLLGMPFGRNHVDEGALQANWQFQTIMGLRQTLNPGRISQWGGVDTEDRLSFLNGTGYTHLLLDRYSGSLIYPLTTSNASNATTEIGADGFYRNGNAAIVLSSYSPTSTPGQETVSLAIPPGLISAGSLSGWRTVRYTPANNVFAAIKSDLAAAHNLQPAFARCSVCTDTATGMAIDPRLVRPMLLANWSRYQSIMQQTLNLGPLTSADGIEFNSSTGTLTATIPANQLIVLESGHW